MPMRLVLLLCALAPSAFAASLRPAVQLAGPSVLLSGLFDDAGPQAGRLLGPGPAPGGRIVVEAPQLAAIARQFHVSWSGTPGARAVLERPGRPLTREAALEALRPALAGAGAPADIEIELGGYEPPLVATDSEVSVAVERCDYDAPSGHFTAQLVASAPSMPTVRLRLAGRVLEMAELPVPVRRVAPGEIVTAADFRLARVRTPAGTELLRSVEEANGLAPRRALLEGLPVLRADLSAVPLVKKGELIRLRLDLPGLLVSATALSLDAAGGGEHVRARNLASGAMLDAIVTGPGEARVLPGSAPLQKGIR